MGSVKQIQISRYLVYGRLLNCFSGYSCDRYLMFETIAVISISLIIFDRLLFLLLTVLF